MDGKRCKFGRTLGQCCDDNVEISKRLQSRIRSIYSCEPTVHVLWAFLTDFHLVIINKLIIGARRIECIMQGELEVASKKCMFLEVTCY